MTYHADRLTTIDLGRRGENLARTVEIDVSSLLNQWPDASIYLLVKRLHDTVPYVAATEVVGGTLHWPITAADTAVEGVGEIEIRAVCGERLAKSNTGTIRVAASMMDGETDPPEAAESWVNQVVLACDGADTAAEQANAAANLANERAAAADTATSTANTAAANADSKAAVAIVAAGNADAATERVNLAVEAANIAATSAATKAESANMAAEAANAAASNANVKAGIAETAAANANTKAALADEKATLADQKATVANIAAVAANTAKKGADAAARAANAAAASVDTAKASAEAATNAANTAAGNADTAAGQANEAAVGANALVGRVDALAEDVQRIEWKTGVKKYIIRWDKVNAACTRMGDAASISTDIAHFAHRGSIDPDYSNPFDGLYPWSHRRLCKADRAQYEAIYSAGGDIIGAITAWEGEPGFALGADAPGMDMVYTPAFWRAQWEDENYVYVGVADGEVQGWTKSPVTIGSRYHASDDGSGGLTSLAGTIAKRFTAMAALHTMAKAQKMTLDDIYTWSDDTVLMCVEFATINAQGAVGCGVHDLYKQDETGHPLEAASAANSVMLPTTYKSAALIGAVLDIGTTAGNGNIASRIITGVTDHADSAYCVITFGGDPLAINTAHYYSIHGMSNTADAQIGSKSGYIGVNGRSIAYYRGREAHGNYWRYVLGSYRQRSTGHIWVANSRGQADAHDALDTGVHTDTGLVLPQGDAGASIGGYINALHLLSAAPLAPFGKSVGGNSANPIGDYIHVPALTAANTILLAGAGASRGSSVGRFFGYWSYSASDSWWHFAASLFLKSPQQGV